MAANSKIQWTKNTFNPWVGCAKVHRGCQHCYAEAFSKRTGKAVWGPEGTRVMSSPSYWQTPLKWSREAEKIGERHRVFCASLADIFEDWQGPILHHGGKQLWTHRTTTGELRAADDDGWMAANGWSPVTMNDLRTMLFRVIDATPHLDWLILTKRPENIERMWRVPSVADVMGLGPEYRGPISTRPRRENVWLLTSVSDQESAEKFVPPLLKCKPLAAVIGVSAEPLVGPIDFTRLRPPACDELDALRGGWHNGSGTIYEDAAAKLDWVIIGGESGGWKTSAPYEIAWAKDIIGQCKRNGTACFHKQLGRVPTLTLQQLLPGEETCKPAALREIAEMDTWPDGTRFGNPTGHENLNGRVVILKDDKGGDEAEWPEPLRVREYPQVEHAEV